MEDLFTILIYNIPERENSCNSLKESDPVLIVSSLGKSSITILPIFILDNVNPCVVSQKE